MNEQTDRRGFVLSHVLSTGNEGEIEQIYVTESCNANRYKSERKADQRHKPELGHGPTLSDNGEDGEDDDEDGNGDDDETCRAAL